MAVHLIIGKICSGKSHCARRMAQEKRAVILSVDEITRSLFPDGLGDAHDAVAARVRTYLLGKARQIAACGTDVILDWGFWTRAMRQEARSALTGAECVWYYLDVPDDRWEENIRSRNAEAAAPGSLDYYVDEGLKAKCLSLFEIPADNEYDVRLP